MTKRITPKRLRKMGAPVLSTKEIKHQAYYLITVYTVVLIGVAIWLIIV